MRTIRIHDTLSGRPEELKTRDANRVGIYACGPTVYARIHVGNARPYVIFALLKRYLEHEGYSVTLVENITDVNDKIYAAAREQGIPSTELAAEMTKAYIDDTDGLGLGRPDQEPLASETIGPIVDLIDKLVAAGYAYQSNGDVYFKVRSFEPYGRLSNRRLEDMESEEMSELKEDQLDFALWKGQKEGEDTAWDSPWGRGRPGWHIECSAMAEQLLGVGFDIHGGGSDLIFPHHENEIAQTEAARGQPLARHWMHNGMVRFADEKMSKSVGNIRLLSVALNEIGRDALIMFFLGTHYRRPLEFSERQIDQARSRIERIRNFHRHLGNASVTGDSEWAGKRTEKFLEALADDFNTPRALAEVFELIGEGNRRMEAGESVAGAAEALAEMLGVLGLDNLLAEEKEIDSEVAELLDERERARAAKDFETADRVRQDIEARGFEVRDTAIGPQLVPKRAAGP